MTDSSSCHTLRDLPSNMFLSLCFFLSVSQISLTLPGEQSSLCWPSTQSENSSNHLFIDWNIRGLRGSEGVGATKSGKDRLAERWGSKRRVVVGVNEMEWRSKKERKLLSEQKGDSFALIRRFQNRQTKRNVKWWKRNANRGYSNWQHC